MKISLPGPEMGRGTVTQSQAGSLLTALLTAPLLSLLCWNELTAQILPFPEIWVTRKESRKEGETGETIILLLETLFLISAPSHPTATPIPPLPLSSNFFWFYLFSDIFFVLQLDWVKCYFPSMLICRFFFFPLSIFWCFTHAFRTVNVFLSYHFFVNTKCFITLLSSRNASSTGVLMFKRSALIAYDGCIRCPAKKSSLQTRKDWLRIQLNFRVKRLVCSKHIKYQLYWQFQGGFFFLNLFDIRQIHPHQNPPYEMQFHFREKSIPK